MRIVRADGTVVEGTPSEIAEFEELQAFKAPSWSTSHRESLPDDACISDESDTVSANTEDWDYASTDVAFRCLTRLKLSKPIKTAIRTIYAGGQRWTSATELQGQIGYNSAQFGGMMGAFGRRFVNTRGYVLNSSFFEYEWDESLSCYKYRLPPTVRAAVVQARVVNEP